MTRKRISVSPATAIATLALFFALGGGSAFAVSEDSSAPQQLREVSRGSSRQSFDEALRAAAAKLTARERRTRLTVTYQIKASNPHIAEFWAILSSG